MSSKVYFYALTADVSGGSEGYGLYVSDGTAAGTTLLSDPAGTYAPSGLLAAGRAVLFPNDVLAPARLFALEATDGVAADTHEVIDFGASFTRFLNAPGYSVSFGGKALLTSLGPGEQLYVTDGSSRGTFSLRLPSPPSPFTLQIDPGFAAIGATVLFSATGPDGNQDLWSTDGTVAGTRLVYRPARPASGTPQSPNYVGLTALGTVAVFEAKDATGLVQLWSTDGTTPGTHALAVANASTATGLRPNSFARFGDRALFQGTDAAGRTGVWITDGTPSGTRELLSNAAGRPGFPTTLFPDTVTVVGGRAFFVSGDATGQRSTALWVTDGTAAGTAEVSGSALVLADGDTVGGDFAALGAALVFRGRNAAGQTGLWITDGTAGGTREIAPAGAGAAGIDPTGMTASDGRVFFHGTDAAGHAGLWVTDGTPGGTTQISVPSFIASGADPQDIFAPEAAAAASTRTVAGTPGNDVFADAPGNQLYIGGGGHDALVLAEGRRGATIRPDGTGDLEVGHGAQLDAVQGIAELRFVDGREVLDGNDPAAQVARLYRAALGREPDQDGLAGWTTALQSGVPLTTVAGGFAGSAEFAGKYGALDAAGYVTLLYRNVLGRAPDPAGLAGWTATLARGTSRAAVLAGFSESDEDKALAAYQTGTGLWVHDEGAAEVARLYDSVLARKPDLAGLSAWTSALDGGRLTLAQVAAGFVQSAEFAAVYGALANRTFVQTLYVNALHRPGDPAGVDAWTQALDTGALTRSGVVLGFSESPEHKASTAAAVDSNDPARYGIALAG